MSRSLYKGPFVDPSLLRKINSLKKKNKDLSIYPIETYSRRSTIISNFLGFVFKVHNGKKFIIVKIKEGMIGHKLGEFASTRHFVKHSGDKGVKKVVKGPKARKR